MIVVGILALVYPVVRAIIASQPLGVECCT
jgi:hypothetical protein